MKRTQIYIDVPTYERAKAIAKASGQTISQLIRNSLSSVITRDTGVNSLEEIAQLSKRVKFPKKTPKNLSATLDQYLYSPK